MGMPQMWCPARWLTPKSTHMLERCWLAVGDLWGWCKMRHQQKLTCQFVAAQMRPNINVVKCVDMHTAQQADAPDFACLAQRASGSGGLPLVACMTCVCMPSWQCKQRCDGSSIVKC